MSFRKPPRGLFITGTNTEVGKTYVTALIARSLREAGHRVGVYKPAASGCLVEGDQLVSEDAVTLWEAIGRSGSLEGVCPQLFRAPLAPHLAAREEGREMDVDLLRTGIEYWFDQCDIVLVEGAGGLMSPMSDDEYVADLADDLGYPLIVVAANELGVINQTLQTLITAVSLGDGLEIAGIVLNDIRQAEEDISTSSNFHQLVDRCTPPMLAHVHYGDETISSETDWFGLTNE